MKTKLEEADEGKDGIDRKVRFKPIISYTVCTYLMCNLQLPRMMNRKGPKSNVWGLVVIRWDRLEEGSAN